MSRDAGFTLLEMLVALVVFGLVMSGLTQTFRFGLTAWSAGPAKTARPENLAAMDAALTQMIAQASPGTLTGQSNALSFTTKLPGEMQSGLTDAAITREADGVLALRYRPHPPGVTLGPPPRAGVETLAKGVTALKAAYLVLQPHAAAPSWSTKWSGDGLPLLIRIHLAFADGRDWPDLVVAPVAAGN